MEISENFKSLRFRVDMPISPSPPAINLRFFFQCFGYKYLKVYYQLSLFNLKKISNIKRSWSFISCYLIFFELWFNTESRMFVGTWNVGGRAPHGGLNLRDWLMSTPFPADVYVIGYVLFVSCWLSSGICCFCC